MNAGAHGANHLGKRFLTLFLILSLTLRYAFDFELDDSRTFSRKVRFHEIQQGCDW
nr:unnamed protein product [Callosobruchus chinensis]